jgi:hypothetical protein
MYTTPYRKRSYSKPFPFPFDFERARYPMLGVTIAAAATWVGALAWRSYVVKGGQLGDSSAFAPSETDDNTIDRTHSGGPKAMRDHQGSKRDKVDQAIDESFLANDPMGA